MLALEESFQETPPAESVIGFPVASLCFRDQISLMMEWAKGKLSKVVCIANVHMLIEAHRDQGFAPILSSADLITPDGMPLVWMLKLQGVRQQDRVAGLDVMLALCEKASADGVSMFFLGSQSVILEQMRARLEREFPDLKIAGMESLPFRPMTVAEDEAIVQKLNQSGAGILFLSLGCPKQEKWMSAHKDRVQMVMIGVGGVFPVYAGIQRRAPRVVRLAGFEWLYRLLQEPQRLWGRYAGTIPIFLWLALKQLLSPRKISVGTKSYSVQ